MRSSVNNVWVGDPGLQRYRLHRVEVLGECSVLDNQCNMLYLKLELVSLVESALSSSVNVNIQQLFIALASSSKRGLGAPAPWFDLAPELHEGALQLMTDYIFWAAPANLRPVVPKTPGEW